MKIIYNRITGEFIDDKPRITHEDIQKEIVAVIGFKAPLDVSSDGMVLIEVPPSLDSVSIDKIKAKIKEVIDNGRL